MEKAGGTAWSLGNEVSNGQKAQKPRFGSLTATSLLLWLAAPAILKQFQPGEISGWKRTGPRADAYVSLPEQLGLFSSLRPAE